MELGGRATGCNRSPVRNAVATGLAQFRNAKDRKKPVHISPVRFFPYLGIYPNLSGSGCLPGMPKNRTGPDFQTLILHSGAVMTSSQILTVVYKRAEIHTRFHSGIRLLSTVFVRQGLLQAC